MCTEYQFEKPSQFSTSECGQLFPCWWNGLRWRATSLQTTGPSCDGEELIGAAVPGLLFADASASVESERVWKAEAPAEKTMEGAHSPWLSGDSPARKTKGERKKEKMISHINNVQEFMPRE